MRAKTLRMDEKRAVEPRTVALGRADWGDVQIIKGGVLNKNNLFFIACVEKDAHNCRGVVRVWV